MIMAAQLLMTEKRQVENHLSLITLMSQAFLGSQTHRTSWPYLLNPISIYNPAHSRLINNVKQSIGQHMRLEEKGVADADDPCSGSDKLCNLKFFLIVLGSCCQNDCGDADCGDDHANSGLYGEQGFADADSDITGVDAEGSNDVEAYFLDTRITNQEHQAQSQQADSRQNHKDDNQQIQEIQHIHFLAFHSFGVVLVSCFVEDRIAQCSIRFAGISCEKNDWRIVLLSNLGGSHNTGEPRHIHIEDI